MFGYVKADMCRLSEKDRQDYKAVYCSLCKSLKKHYGFTARYILNYDIAFLAAVRLSRCSGDFREYQSYCPYKCRKCTFICDEDNILYECSAVLIMLAYHKICDNIKDEKLFKRILYSALKFHYGFKYRKAKKLLPETALMIEKNMALQNEYENRENSTFDMLAHPSADGLGNLFAFGAPETEKDDFYRFGYCVGRWIYIVDAADDYYEDKKNGRFNPFRSDFSTERVTALLNHSVAEALEAYEKIKDMKYKNVLDNILYDGTEKIQNSVLGKEE